MTTSEQEHLRVDPWFDDGNIVLVAQGKAFRVHRGVLGANSGVFKDMITIPQPGDAKENTIDGCPVVHLQDAPDDVQIMLKALYDRSYPFHDGKLMPFEVLRTFLRMGDKYAIRQLSRDALNHLSLDVPHLELASRVSNEFTVDSSLCPRISDIDPHYFELANLSAEMGCFSALAIAIYYCCVACPMSYLNDGYDAMGTRHTLSMQNLRYCLLGQHYIAEANKKLILILTDQQLDHRLLHAFLSFRGPFIAWKDDWNRYNVDDYIKEWYEETRKELWDDFPVQLGLGRWDDVHKDLIP